MRRAPLALRRISEYLAGSRPQMPVPGYPRVCPVRRFQPGAARLRRILWYRSGFSRKSIR
jgi:hypothetical protein